jgi:hypothetical protein
LIVPSPTPFHHSLGNRAADALEMHCPSDFFISTDGLVTLDRPWEITLNLPAWTARRDQVREAARPKD